MLLGMRSLLRLAGVVLRLQLAHVRLGVRVRDLLMVLRHVLNLSVGLRLCLRLHLLWLWLLRMLLLGHGLRLLGLLLLLLSLLRLRGARHR